MKLRDPSKMTNEELREEIKLWVYTISHWLSRDTTAFIYIKRLAKISQYLGIGGGNMLVATACFGCLDFFAGIHEHLTDGAGLWSKDKISDYDSIIQRMKQAGFTRKEISMVSRPRPVMGTIKNINASVRKLLQALESKRSMVSGLPVQDDQAFSKLWDAFRNNLAHTMTPALGTAVNAMSSNNIKSLKLRSDRFKRGFYLQADPGFELITRDKITRWEFAADRFAMGFMIGAADYIRNLAQECDDRDKLIAAINFIRGKSLPGKLLRK